jgi:hypothetical protein
LGGLFIGLVPAINTVPVAKVKIGEGTRGSGGSFSNFSHILSLELEIGEIEQLLIS